MEALPVVQGGALAVLTVFSGWCLYAILRGLLIPRSWVEAMRTQDKVIEADLRSRLEDSNQAVQIEREQKNYLLHELGPTVTRALNALPKAGDEG